MIYDRDAAFQHRMINLFWEHFTSTSLTYLGLAHAPTHTHTYTDDLVHNITRHKRKRTRTLHARDKCRGRVHASAFACHPCATPQTPFPNTPLLVSASFILTAPHTHTHTPTSLTFTPLLIRLVHSSQTVTDAHSQRLSERGMGRTSL